MAGLFWALKSLKLVRLIEDVPTAKIRSAPQGYVELVGNADVLDGEPIIAPLTNVSCCWYRYQVQRRKDNKWQTVDSGVSDGLFLIKDNTGQCIIDPEGAEVTIAKEEKWAGETAMPVVVNGNIVRAGRYEFGSSYRYTEAVLLPGQRLYAIGNFKTLDDLDRLSQHKELLGEILREWKQQPATLKARFDHNRDGVIDEDEWTDAVRVAKKEAAKQQLEQMSNPHLHLLNQPLKKQYPFLLSFIPETVLIKRYRWKSAGGLVVFFIMGAISTLLLTVRLL